MNILKTEEDRIKDFRRYAGDIFTGKTIEKLQEMKYFQQPASTKFHGTREGDLYLHSKIVALLLEEWTEKLGLQWQRKDSPRRIGLLHDLCKADEYIKVPDNTIKMFPNDPFSTEVLESDEYHFEYNKNTKLKGHGDKSAILALQMVRDLTDEEVMCIRYHMGAFKTEEWDSYRTAAKKYKNVLWTAQADLIAAWILEV